MHEAAVDGDRPLLEVDADRPHLEDGLSGRPGTTEDGAQACEQLAHRERLRHVVVGAGVERGDLLRLVADGGDDDDRHAAPATHLAADVDAAAVRQDQVQQHRVGRPVRQCVERLLLRRGRVDLEAGVAQHHAQATDDLRLVVHDEDARALCHLSRPAMAAWPRGS